MHFSDKYTPLLAKSTCREIINSQGFKDLSEEEKQFYLSLDKVTNFVLTGGRGSGKSTVVEADAHIRSHKYGHKTYYARYTNDSLEETVIADFTDIMEKLPVPCDFQTNKIKYPNNGRIVFKGLKRGSKAQTAGGKGLSTFNCLVVEEAEEHPAYEEYDKMKLSLRRDDLPNYAILLLNPTTKEHWIYQEFFESREVEDGINQIIGDTCYIHTTYLDVPKKYHTTENWQSYENGRKAYEEYESLKPKEKELAPNKLKNLHNWYKHIILGGWLDKAEGVIFESWERGEFPDHLPYVFGLDFGAKDPDALTKVAVDKRTKTVYIEEILHKTGLGVNDLYKAIYPIVGKTLIVADAAGKKNIIDLRKLGLNITKCRKPKVVDRIKYFLDFNIVVCGKSPNMIKEFNNYVWLDKNGEHPEDAFNHLMDSWMYGATKIVEGNRGLVRI